MNKMKLKNKRSTIKNSNDSQNTLSSSISSRNTFNKITSRNKITLQKEVNHWKKNVLCGKISKN